MMRKEKNFAVIGVGGYVAPRHLKAIKDTGNKLVAAVDPHDSVGILDKYGFDIRYFKDIERFDRFMDKLRRQRDERQIDWVSICSPNYLHDAHIRLSLRNSTNVICEKPIVINPWNLDALKVIEEETERKVFTVLQLRVHPELLKLKEEINNKRNRRFQVEMTYITPRGQWYFHSWKGREEFSGGIAVNIGIHLFDLLIWLFGDPVKSEVHYKDESKKCGALVLKNADVVWFLSIDGNDLPDEIKRKGSGSFRKINIDGKNVEFSEGFTELHTILYEKTLRGEGFGIEEARKSIELVYNLRASKLNQTMPHHPLFKKEKRDEE